MKLSRSNRISLTYEELCQLKWLTGNLLLLLSLWTLYYVEAELFILLSLTLVTVLVVSALPRLPSRIPAYVWKVSTPVLMLVVFLDFFLSAPDIIAPLIRLLVYISLVRTLQHRTRREDLQHVMICLFMVIIAGVLTLSMSFALQILLFMPCAMVLLFIINLTENHEQVGADQSVNQWKGFRWGHFFCRMKRAFDWRLAGLTLLLFSLILAISALIFVLMPRFRLDQAIPFLNLASRTSRSGFSENIQFGDVTEIIEDNSVALRVDTPDGKPLSTSPYWRMIVLDLYQDGRFKKSPSADRNTTSVRDSNMIWPGYNGMLQSKFGRPEDKGDYTFYFEGGISRYIPALGSYREIHFQNREDVDFNLNLQISSTRNVRSSVLFYQLSDLRPANQFAGVVADQRLVFLTPRYVSQQEIRKIHYPETTLLLPQGNATRRVLDSIVQEITGGNQLQAEDFSRKAVDWLQNHHRYSLNSSIPEGPEDIVVRWLRSDQPGHCELFAGAFTLIARSAGYPTRIVTGYKGGTWNEYENYYMVRNKNAHAWCEVYDVNKQIWFRVDPTGTSEGLADTDPISGGSGYYSGDNSVMAYLDSLRVLWYRRVVNFSRQDQEDLATGMQNYGKAFFHNISEWGRDYSDRIAAWFKSPWNLEKAGRFFTMMSITLGIYLLLRFLPRWIRLWMSILGIKMGSKLITSPIRKKAGRLVADFRDQQTRFSNKSVPLPNEWDSVFLSLLNLRFGDEPDWPNPEPVFRRAKNMLKQKPVQPGDR